MFTNRKATTERTFNANQSLFQFLKRKKHGELQTSLKINSSSKSSRKDYHNRARSVFFNTIDQFAVQQTYRNQNQQNQNSISQSITPRKIRFDVQKKGSLGKTNRPFIEMISPFKNKICSYSDKKQNQSISMKNIYKGTQLYSKKKINESLNLIKTTFHKFVQAGQTTKEKCNSIFIRLSQISRNIQNQTDQITLKKISQLKNNFKAIQSILSIFDSNNTGSILQQFHKMMSEHLNTIESVNYQHFKKEAQQQVKALAIQKDIRINELQKALSQLNRQNSLMQKNVQKSQTQLQKAIQKFQEREQNLVQQKQKIEDKLQQKLKRLQQQNQRKGQLLSDVQSNFKQMQKELKNQKYNRQFIQKKQSKEQQLVRQTREKFLVQQIQKLKNQFTSDIDKLHILYQSKNQQLVDKIVFLEKEIVFCNEQKHKDKQIFAKILQQTRITKQQNVSLLKKNDSILTDMYRMNQQLYQHWLALKDIQTLSQRLCLFQNFKTIYKDLSFNPILFS